MADTVPDLPSLIPLIEKIRETHRTTWPDPDAAYELWREKRAEANAASLAALQALGARVTHDWRGAVIKLAGVRSSSTGGMAGAMSNWLTAARKKLAAAEDPFNPHGSGPVPIEARKEQS